MEQPAFSQQLRMLRDLGLVVGDRKGRQVIYALRDDHIAAAIRGCPVNSRAADDSHTSREAGDGHGTLSGKDVTSGGFKTISSCRQNFIAFDRGQTMLMPPDLTDCAAGRR